MEFLKKNKVAVGIYATFLTIGLAVLLFNDKIHIQTSINEFSAPVGTIIFLFLTHMAEGWGTVPVLIFLLIKNWRWFVYMVLIYGVSALITWALKQFAFPRARRPFSDKIISAMSDYKWVEGINYPGYNSFPSGHTTTAFCFCFGLCLILPNKKLQYILIPLGILIGFSRTYLSYHFFSDVVAGSAVGVFTAILFYFLLKKALKLNPTQV